MEEAWEDVTNLNINNFCEKSCIKGNNEPMEVKEDDDLEFESYL